MASTTLQVGTFYAPSASVKAYPASNWLASALPPTGSPVGSESATASVGSDGTLTFTGLTEGTDYYAYASGGTPAYVRFRADAQSATMVPGTHSSLTSPTYGQAVVFGNKTNSFGHGGTGSPADIFAPVAIYQVYGIESNTQSTFADITKTTQAFYATSTYYGRTLDDSQQCGSCFVSAKWTGRQYTQAKHVTGFEGRADVEGSNIISDGAGSAFLTGIAGRIGVHGSASVDDAHVVYAGLVLKATGGTFTGNTTNGSATISNVSDFTNLELGSIVSGTGITGGSYVTRLNPTASPPNIVINTLASATNTGITVTIAPPTITRYAAFYENTANANVGTDSWTLYGVNDVEVGGFRGNNAYYSDQPLGAALGYKTWVGDPGLWQTAQAPVAGTIYAVAVPYRKGQVVTNTHWYVNTAGAGTAPTHIYTGVADSSGKILVKSNDLAASAEWTTAGARVASAANSGTYTIPSSGLYYHVILQVGAWGTTQMTLNRATGPVGLPSLAQATGGTGQTALPNVGSSLTLVNTSSFRFWTGAT